MWLEKEPFGTPKGGAAPVASSTHASDADAQSLFNTMFDAIGALELPPEDLDAHVHSEALLPHVAQYAGALATDEVRLPVLKDVLEIADTVWQRVTPSSSGPTSAVWRNLGEFLNCLLYTSPSPRD